MHGVADLNVPSGPATHLPGERGGRDTPAREEALALARDYGERGDSEHEFKVLKDVVWADPFAQDLHIRLGNLYLSHNDPAKALREYLVLLSLNPPDKADANYKVALEVLARPHRDEYYLDSVPELPWDKVGGQHAALQAIRQSKG